MKSPVSKTFTALPTSWLWPGGPPVWQISLLGGAVALTSVAVPALPTVLPDKPAPAQTQSQARTGGGAEIGGSVGGGDGGTGQVPSTDPAAVPTVTAVRPSAAPIETPSEQPRASEAAPSAGPSAEPGVTPAPSPDGPVATSPTPEAPQDDSVTIAASDPANGRFLVSSADCPTCASGSRIIGIGLLATLTVPVTVDAAGSRALSIAYESTTERTLYVSVNGGPSQKLTVAASGGWQTPAWTGTTIELRAGENEIKFHNPLGLAPDVDQISLG
ncbi:carbohydrate-binding protein [Kineosporia succinea]|uniref:CBM6 domain-containing protein n=1 Tax=Kineosporia succinea TaxID=84632 RepID=A0ABT9PAV7_9ACTN|nr:hypothetical protein [Kineosporia succinea]MDP9829175.1 hypothetical protein [Kineosporia succinea]